MKNQEVYFRKNIRIISIFIIFPIFFFLIVNPIFAQSLKNIKIGEKYSGPRNIETTVGGYEGKLTIITLKDETVSKLYFLSNEKVEDRSDIQLHHIKADRLLENISSNYNLIFNRTMWKHNENLTGNWHDIAYSEKEGIDYMLSSKISLMDQKSEITFILTSIELIDKGRKENDVDF